jgi:hypothetical protein
MKLLLARYALVLLPALVASPRAAVRRLPGRRRPCPPRPYAAERESSDSRETTFHVTTRHPGGTTMDWTASVKGDAVDGKAHRTMNGKTDILGFKGALRP